MKFVTAIYDNLHGTKFGGRLNRDRHYLYSLKTLLGMGTEFVCYTSDSEYDDLVKAFAEFDNIQFKKYNLDSYEFHDRIHEIKEFNKKTYAEDNVWEHRCVELMWLKLEWIFNESRDYDGKVFWIDAGISHNGILPRKFNIHNSENLTYEETFANAYAFNENFLNKLDINSDKFFSFYCNNRQHQYPKILRNDEHLPGSIVAGILGGTKEYIESVYFKFKPIIEFIMNNNDLTQEEMALTLVYRDSPSLFSIVDFDTWYHDDWDCYDRQLKSFSSFFDNL